MKDYAKFWAQLRAPLLELGEWGPVVFLIVTFTALSFVNYRWALPFLRRVLPVEVDAWKAQLKGLWFAVFAAVFAASTTPVALENTLIALFAGASIVALRNVKSWAPKLVEYMRAQLFTSLILVLVFTLMGCGTPPLNTAREACYVRAAVNYQEQSSHCDTDQCIDDLEPGYKADQEACP